MSLDSASSSYTITLPSQPREPVRIVAGPGVSQSDFRQAIGSSLFKKWINNIEGNDGVLSDGSMCLKQVVIQGVDMFRSGVGFLKFKADVIDSETAKKVPGIVFARGPSVAVLILLESDGELYAILTKQVRIPVGRATLELPAGMNHDDTANSRQTAAREVEEEIGMHVNVDAMVELTALLDSSTGCRIFPSPGGCDEEVSIFLYRESVDKDVIEQLRGKRGGLREHGELIKTEVVFYRDLWRVTSDAKALCAIALYEMAMREGVLPPLPHYVVRSPP